MSTIVIANGFMLAKAIRFRSLSLILLYCFQIFFRLDCFYFNSAVYNKLFKILAKKVIADRFMVADEIFSDDFPCSQY